MGSGSSADAARSPAVIDSCIAQASASAAGDPVMLRCVSSDNDSAWSATSISDLPAEIQDDARALINKNALATGKSNLFSSIIFSPTRGSDGQLLLRVVTGSSSQPSPTGNKGEPVAEQMLFMVGS